MFFSLISGIPEPHLISFAMVILMCIKGLVAFPLSERLTESSNDMEFKKKIKLRSSCWKSIYYSISAVYGALFLYSADWATKIHTYTYKYTVIPFQFRIYYFMSIGYYINEFVVLFVDPRRKDFLQMALHHVSTLLLLFCSYKTGFVRYGAAILFIHDISDPLLELAKIFVYLEKKIAADVVFFIFMCTFMVSRLYVYPVYLVYPGCKDMFNAGMTKEHSIIVVGLVSLVVMHVIWTYYILKIFLKVLETGRSKDVRSKESGY